ncbi:DUF3140 domain-containing protein [Micromonospora endolithica]|uniref:DUF3140 domain-containing protein n=1 Tax=Micromonospora endolithica TaxID=230091 RepID=A0A3A9ZKM1_9ACTN|nr:DUF3140 domain-containing protein [Micromonospora endolithica]RKN48645.1 DUF3140 domain-containing protein [Micromonospora endolithica]TWJ22018.1 uncharacterized protein DUF3140 [Micromonospora endolithica]
MVRQQRIDPEVDVLWDSFHERVNVPSEQLRQWLLTRGSGAEAFGPNPDLDLPEPGRHVLRILTKRKVDLTPDDIETMRDTVDEIENLLAAKPPRGNADDQWRHSLLDLGHDVLVER